MNCPECGTPITYNNCVPCWKRKGYSMRSDGWMSADIQALSENGWTKVKETGCFVSWGIPNLKNECVLMGEMFGTAARAVDLNGMVITSCNPQERQPSVIVTDVHYSGQDDDYDVMYNGRSYLVPSVFLYGKMSKRGGYDNRSKVWCLYSFIERELEAGISIQDMFCTAHIVKTTNDDTICFFDAEPGEIVRFKFGGILFIYFKDQKEGKYGDKNRWFWIKNGQLNSSLDQPTRKRLASLATMYTGYPEVVKED